MPVRYVITTLKPGVKPEDYERWLREYDYPVARTLPSIVSYRTSRIAGPINGAEHAGWSYIERIEVRDVEQYQKDLASPAGQEPFTPCTASEKSAVYSSMSTSFRQLPCCL